MFTGIVQDAYAVKDVKRFEGLLTFSLDVAPTVIEGVEIGASVAVDGVCLTVTKIEGMTLTFDMMQQTLAMTTLAEIQEGELVNVERSMKPGGEVGGHIVSGHVDGTAEIIRIDTPPNNFVMTLRLPEAWMKYVFPKGFLALNGVSLTVAEADKAAATVTVYLIPETLRRTTFGKKHEGDRINFEVERQTQAVVDTIRDFLGELIERHALKGEDLKRLQEAPLMLIADEKKNDSV